MLVSYNLVLFALINLVVLDNTILIISSVKILGFSVLYQCGKA